MKKNTFKHLIAFLVILALTACGGGASTMATTESSETKGQVIDAPVANLSYTCEDGKTDKTDDNGTFSCTTFPVTFSFGDIKLGSIDAITSDAKVYPQDIVGVDRDDFTNEGVVKVGYLLQVFDTDGDISKSIELDESILVSDAKDLKDLSFSELDSIIRTSGRTPLDIEDVRTHLINNAGNEVNQTTAKNLQSVSIDSEELTLGDLTNVTADLIFPSTGDKGSSISYAIVSGSAISTEGVVMRPTFTDKSQIVSIKATIVKGEASITKDFLATVIALPINDVEAIILALEDLSVSGTLSAVDGNLELVTTSLHDVAVSWESSSINIRFTGEVTRPSFNNGNINNITLTAILTIGSETRTKVFENITVLKLPISDAESVANVKANLSLANLEALRENITLAILIDGVTLTWKSSNASVVSDGGVIFPDNYQGTDKTAALELTLTKGSVTDTRTYELTVPKALITDEESVDAVLPQLSVVESNKLDGEFLTNITLVTTGSNDVNIVWNSSDLSLVTTGGVISKAPLSSGGFVNVKLTATVSKDEISKSKEFTIKILINPTDEDSVDYELSEFNLTTEAYDNITNSELFDMPSTTSYLGVDVTYTSSNTAVFLASDNGDKPTINPQSFTNGDVELTVVATFIVNDVVKSKEFNLTIRPLDMNTSEAIHDATTTLVFDDIKNANSSEQNILTNLILPSTFLASNGSTITVKWASNNEGISDTGVVTRNTFINGDKNVTLIATLGVDDGNGGFVAEFGTETKTFILTVVKKDAIIADLVNLAVGADLNSVLVVKGAYNLELYTNAVAPTTLSQETFAVYGNIQGVEGVVLLEAHSAYPIGTQFQVLVKDQNNNVLAKSAVVTSLEGETGVNFGTITID